MVIKLFKIWFSDIFIPTVKSYLEKKEESETATILFMDDAHFQRYDQSRGNQDIKAISLNSSVIYFKKQLQR